MTNKLLPLLLFLCAPAFAQLGQRTLTVTSDPSGACVANPIVPQRYNKINGRQWACLDTNNDGTGVWAETTISAVTDAQVPNNITIDLSAAAVALASNPTDCATANTFATAIAANGDLTCLYPLLPPNAQTGTSYTVLSTDASKFITFSNASAVAVTVPQATGSFASGYWFIAKNIGAADATLTPTTSTISGTTSIVLSTGEWALVRSDGTNYEAISNRTTAGSNVTLTKSRTGVSIAASGGGGTGCVPGGSADQVLVDDGAGECDSTLVEIDGDGNITTPGTISTGDGSVAGCVELKELLANGSNFRLLCVPDALTQDLTRKEPDGNPAGSVVKYPTPTSSVSQGVYVKAAEVDGTPSAGNCPEWVDDHTIGDSGDPCGSGGGGDTYANFDPTAMHLWDEFLSSAGAYVGANYPSYGQLGWGRNCAGDPELVIAVSGFVMPGQLRLNTAGSANSLCAISGAGPSFAGPEFYNLVGTTGWDFVFIIKNDHNYTTQTRWIVGLANADSALPTNGIYASYTNNSSCTNTGSDTAWQFTTRAASTSTTTTTGVAVGGGEITRIHIYSDTIGTVAMEISENGGAYSTPVTSSTNVPSVALAPVFVVISCDTNLHAMFVDRFDAWVTGLGR